MTTYEDLQAQLDSLTAEVAALRSSAGATAAQAEVPARVLSRRNLLRAAPIAAIGGAVAAMAATPAAAAVGDPVLIGHSNVGAGSTTTLSGGTPAPDAGVPEDSSPALAVVGGIVGDWLEVSGVDIGSSDGAALTVSASYLLGDAAHFSGPDLPVLHGIAGGSAVLIDAMGAGTALTITTTDGAFDTPNGPTTILPGVGIDVSTVTGNAVRASSEQTAVAIESTSTTSSADAVTIDYEGTSRALYAQSHLTTNINGTITGVNEGHGIGVWGEQRNNTGSGFGVVGVGGTLGRGAQFTGGAAPVRMVPSSAASHPSTGKVGDFFVDASARLWFCKKSSTSTVAAVWHQVA